MATITAATAENPDVNLIPSTPNPDIVKERKTASFDPYQMTIYLDGNEQETKTRRQMGK